MNKTSVFDSMFCFATVMYIFMLYLKFNTREIHVIVFLLLSLQFLFFSTLQQIIVLKISFKIKHQSLENPHDDWAVGLFKKF